MCAGPHPRRGYLRDVGVLFDEPRKFDGPLRKWVTEKFIDRLKAGRPYWEDIPLLAHHPETELLASRLSTDFLPRMIQDILDHVVRRPQELDVGDAAETLSRALRVQVERINSSFGPGAEHLRMPSYSVAELSRVIGDRTVLCALGALEGLKEIPVAMASYGEKPSRRSDLLANIRHSAHSSRYYLRALRSWSFTLSRGVCVVGRGGQMWVVQKSAILEMENKLRDLISVLMLSKMMEGGPLPLNSLALTKSMIRVLCTSHCCYPGTFFSLVSTLEGLAVATIIAREEDWVNTRLLEKLRTDIREIEGGHWFLSNVERIFSSASTELVAELSCLSKITGHPLVSAIEGAQKIYGRSMEELPLDPDVISQVVNIVKHDYVVRYRERKGVWPPLIMGEGAPQRLTTAHQRNRIVRRFPREANEPRTEDFAHVSLARDKSFDIVNLDLEELKDKSLSPSMSALRSRYGTEIFRDLEQMGGAQLETWAVACQKPEFRRQCSLLLHFLYAPLSELDIEKTIRRFAYDSVTDPEMAFEYFVMKLVEKEKELKEPPRIFGSQTYVNRSIRRSVERSIESYLRDYIPEQVLTSGDMEYVRKIEAFKNWRTIKPGFRVAYVNFDASGWCYTFREGSTVPPCREVFDRVFGVHAFSKIMQCFGQTHFYSSEGDSNLVYHGQLGGIQGLHQFTWDAVYIPQMARELRKQGLEFHILCKGDDFRAAVLVPESQCPTDEAFAAKVEELKVEVCEAASRNFGYKIKATDSYASESVMVFSKKIYVKGVELSQVFRMGAKIHGTQDMTLDSLDSRVANIFANCHSACASSTVYIPQYATALFWAYYNMVDSRIYRPISQAKRVSLLLAPSVVGGFPIIPLYSCFLRAESDLLSSALDLMMTALAVDPEVGALLKNLCGQPPAPRKQWTNLMRDPYALNRSSPPPPLTILRRHIRILLEKEFREGKAKNEMVREFLSLYGNAGTLGWDACFSNCGVIRAKLLASWFENSPFTLVDTLIARFESSKTVSSFLSDARLPKRKQNEIKAGLQRDQDLLDEWRVQALDPPREQSDAIRAALDLRCPAESADKLREAHWGVRVETVTAPPPTHMLALMSPYQAVIGSVAEVERRARNHFGVEISLPGDSRRSAHMTKGGAKAFLGETTALGVSGPALELEEKSLVGRRVLNLLMLRSWARTPRPMIADETVTAQSSLVELIDLSLSAYGYPAEATLEPFSRPRVRGTESHHMRAHNFRESIAPNHPTHLTTIAATAASTHQVFSLRDVNRPLNFLQMKGYIHQLLCLHLHRNRDYLIRDQESFWAITTSCKWCNQELREHAMVFEIPPQIKKGFPQLQHLSLSVECKERIEVALAEYSTDRRLVPILYEYSPDSTRVFQHSICRTILRQADIQLAATVAYSAGEISEGTIENVSMAYRSGARSTSLKDDIMRFVDVRLVSTILVKELLTHLIRLTAGSDVALAVARLNMTRSHRIPWMSLVDAAQRSGVYHTLARSLAEVLGESVSSLEVSSNKEFARSLCTATCMSVANAGIPDEDEDLIVPVPPGASEEDVIQAVERQCRGYFLLMASKVWAKSVWELGPLEPNEYREAAVFSYFADRWTIPHQWGEFFEELRREGHFWERIPQWEWLEDEDSPFPWSAVGATTVRLLGQSGETVPNPEWIMLDMQELCEELEDRPMGRRPVAHTVGPLVRIHTVNPVDAQDYLKTYVPPLRRDSDRDPTVLSRRGPSDLFQPSWEDPLQDHVHGLWNIDDFVRWVPLQEIPDLDLTRYEAYHYGRSTCLMQLSTIAPSRMAEFLYRSGANRAASCSPLLFTAEGRGGGMWAALAFWTKLSACYNSYFGPSETSKAPDDCLLMGVESYRICLGMVTTDNDLSVPGCLDRQSFGDNEYPLVWCDLDHLKGGSLARVLTNVCDYAVPRLSPGGRVVWRSTVQMIGHLYEGLICLRQYFESIQVMPLLCTGARVEILLICTSPHEEKKEALFPAGLLDKLRHMTEDIRDPARAPSYELYFTQFCAWWRKYFQNKYVASGLVLKRSLGPLSPDLIRADRSHLITLVAKHSANMITILRGDCDLRSARGCLDEVVVCQGALEGLRHGVPLRPSAYYHIAQSALTQTMRYIEDAGLTRWVFAQSEDRGDMWLLSEAGTTRRESVFLHDRLVAGLASSASLLHWAAPRNPRMAGRRWAGQPGH